MAQRILSRTVPWAVDGINRRSLRFATREGSTVQEEYPMKVSKIALCSSALMFTLVSNSYLMAQNSASNTDKAFVSKVSQGGRYEVEASRLALAKANAQNVKDLANTEVHDHELVGKKLKDISV